MSSVVAGIQVAFEALRLLAIVGPAVAKVLKATIETFQRLAKEWQTVEPEDVAATFDQLQTLARSYVLTAATLNLGPEVDPAQQGLIRFDSALRALHEAAKAMNTPLPDRIAEKITQDAYVEARNDADELNVPLAEIAAAEGVAEQ